jgi:hypothetical protein
VNEGCTGYPSMTYHRQGQDSLHQRGIGDGIMMLPLSLLSTSLTTALSSVWGVRPICFIRFNDVINSNRLPFLASFWLSFDKMHVKWQGF